MIREAIDLGYRKVGYPLLNAGSQGDPENPHLKVLGLLERVDQSATLLQLARWVGDYVDPSLLVKFGPYIVRHPIGLAAGMDKDFRAPNAFGAIFSEVCLGSATYREWAGNKRPRIVRFPADQSQNNWMGFPGSGTKAAALNIKNRIPHFRDRQYVVTASVAGSFPTFEAGTVVGDYQKATEDLTQYPDQVDAVEENVSSPNTPTLRSYFGDLGNIKEVTLAVKSVVREANKNRSRYLPPILFGVKISPDLINTDAQTAIERYAPLDQLIKLLMDKETRVDFITATNTTVDPEIRASLEDPLAVSLRQDAKLTGGTSGKLLKEKSFEVNKHIFDTTGGSILQKAAGGITDENDIWTFVASAGANFVECLTGPVMPDTTSLLFARRPNQRLVQMMKAAGVRDINELRGSKLPPPSCDYGILGNRFYYLP